MKLDFNRLIDKLRGAKPQKTKKIVIPSGFPFSLSEDGKSVLFGRYPQDLCLPQDVISDAPNGDGFHTIIGSGIAVQKVTIAEDVVLSHSRKLSKGQSCYFKLQPIEWTILSQTENEMVLMSEKLLDCKVFNETDSMRLTERRDHNGFEIKYSSSDVSNMPANNWEVSTLREWLNWDFKDTCFNDDEQQCLAVVWTGDSVVEGEKYSDDVSIPDIEAVTSRENGFLPMGEKDERRRAVCTEYCRAMGAECRQEYGSWWLRSAGFTTYNVSRVFYDGYLNETGKSIDLRGMGVRPIIKLKY